MRTAHPIATSALGTTDAVRVMVLSDYNPNVGATTPSEFQRLALEGAADGIGLTLFGLGLGLAPEVMTAMSELRGGNAFSLTSPDDVDPLIEDSWPWMVSPIAYDLSVRLQASSGFRLAAAYGFPGNEGDTEAALEVASVFLSRRKGAMLIQLRPVEGTAIGEAEAALSLGYVTVDGVSMTESLTARYGGEALDESGRYLPQRGLAKTVALALLVSGMRDAATRYASDKSGVGAERRRLDRGRSRQRTGPAREVPWLRAYGDSGRHRGWHRGLRQRAGCGNLLPDGVVAQAPVRCVACSQDADDDRRADR